MVCVIVVHYLRRSSKIKKDKLDPWFISGFSDAESSFGCVVAKSGTIKLGWQVSPKFAIKLHKNDLNLLALRAPTRGAQGIIFFKLLKNAFFNNKKNLVLLSYSWQGLSNQTWAGPRSRRNI